uniref:uncharacterized protein LOC122578643 n=1 Tax=Erigeron canadensis TaxID=72917 RepID=UPI001CB94E16|nr:uncharacterized protein LOC122578643 [Erigeron canadensis]
MDEHSVTSSNKSTHFESMLELQQTQLVLLEKEQNRLRSTQDEQTTKLDEVLDYQSSFEDNIRNRMSEEVRQLVSQEIGKVALEVRKAVAQEVGKSVAQEIGKAQRQILEAIQRR